MFFINFKCYQSGTGQGAVHIAGFCQEIGQLYKASFIPVVQAVDLYEIAQQVKIPVWVQSADAREPRKNTGYVSPYALKTAGAAGVFLNHSDCPKDQEDIKKLIGMARELGLQTLVFAKNGEEIRLFDQWQPDYVSWEDPQLIASETAMVDKYQDELKKMIHTTHTPFVIGAGIRTKDHYLKARVLGAAGVVISSQVMEATDPRQALEKLVA
jgi:triosephosphate isomerase